jgi:hypothetical protein
MHGLFLYIRIYILAETVNPINPKALKQNGKGGKEKDATGRGRGQGEGKKRGSRRGRGRADESESEDGSPSFG